MICYNRSMVESTSDLDSLPTRDKLDILLLNEKLDPKIATTVKELSDNLRKGNRYPTYYEEVLVMFLQDPSGFVLHPDMEEMYSNNDPTQSVSNLLHRLGAKLEEICKDNDFVIERETVVAHRLVVRSKNPKPSSE